MLHCSMRQYRGYRRFVKLAAEWFLSYNATQYSCEESLTSARRSRQGCWRATNIDQERALNFDQAFYCVANYTTVDKSTRL